MKILVPNRFLITFLVVLSHVSSLTACAPIIYVPLETQENNPFNENKELISSGKFLKADVHSILGVPCWQSDKGDVEVYGAWGSREEFYLDGPIIPIIPSSAGKYWWAYYLIVNYDIYNRVATVTDASETELAPDIRCKIPDIE